VFWIMRSGAAVLRKASFFIPSLWDLCSALQVIHFWSD